MSVAALHLHTKTLSAVCAGERGVLYPVLLRDLLIRLAREELFQAKWTEKIHDEWISALCRNRPDLSPLKLARTKEKINQAVPDCLVDNYEMFIDNFHLPDPNDRHVLAAAFSTRADMIVTLNTKDFPNGYLSQFNIEAVHPDQFILCQFDLAEDRVISAIQKQLQALKNPPYTIDEYIETIEKSGLLQTAARLREIGLSKFIPQPPKMERKLVPLLSSKVH